MRFMRVNFSSENVFSFDFAALMDDLKPEDKLRLAESLACESAIIAHVTAQILDGWTESGFRGSKGCTAPDDPAPHYGLDWAVRQVAKRSSEVAAKEIARLEDALAKKEKDLQSAYRDNYELRHGREPR